MESTREHISKACSTIGPSCIVAFALLSDASRAFFSDFDFAFSEQLPLTISGDAGCIVAILIGTACLKSLKSASRGYLFALSAAGAAIAALAKLGLFGENDSIALVGGDALSSTFSALCVLLWWQTMLEQSEREDARIERRIAAVGLAACAIFLGVALLPAHISGIFAAIVLPCVSCLCFAPFAGRPTHSSAADSEESESNNRIPTVVALITVLSCIVVDLLVDLFPVSLFYDGPALGSLCLPGALCAALCMALSIAVLVITRKASLPLGLLYFPGFFIAIIGYLLSPYRPLNGAPLGASEAGQLIICMFILAIALRTAGDNSSRRLEMSLKIALLASSTMLVCDIAIVALQLSPGFDYSDFVFRTTFSGIGIAALAILLLGPLPRFEIMFARKETERPSATSSKNYEPAAAKIAANLSAQRALLIEHFAKEHGLTTRETEIFALMAAGRDVPYIERELVLAKSTVKTHVKHIYAKCGVSSKQDLIDLLEAFEA